VPFIGRGGSSPPSDTSKWEPPHLPEPQSGSPRQPASTVPPGTGAATIPPAAPLPGDSDAAVLRRLLASADSRATGTGPRMPNAAPPLPPVARRRGRAVPVPRPSRRVPGRGHRARARGVARAERCAALLGRVRRAAGRHRRADADPTHSAWQPSPPATRAPARPWTCPAWGRCPPTRASPGSDTLIRARDGKGRARPRHMINKRARTSLGMGSLRTGRRRCRPTRRSPVPSPRWRPCDAVRDVRKSMRRMMRSRK
jgi:hypothetical protein